MSKGFSYAQVGGGLGRDPDIRSTPNGVKVANFSVAVDKGFGDKKSTHWFNVVAFKDLAEFAEKYLKKGSAVNVTGDLQTKSWVDKQSGANRTATEIVALRIDFADGGSKSDSGQTTRAAAPAQTRQQTAPAPRATTPVTDDDPFAEEPF